MLRIWRDETNAARLISFELEDDAVAMAVHAMTPAERAVLDQPAQQASDHLYRAYLIAKVLERLAGKGVVMPARPPLVLVRGEPKP